MPEAPASKKTISPDWLVQGILTKLGDTFDKLTGRGWKPSSSLATSELIERLKALLDSEAEPSEDGRGTFVPHNIKLKMQWDKFSTDSETDLVKLENELLTAAVDHINDKRYFTHKPLSVEVKPDYFTQGVRLLVSFERFDDDDDEASINLLHTTGQLSSEKPEVETAVSAPERFRFTFAESEKPKTVEISFEPGQRRSVGRTKENDIFINDASVSKLHASLALNADGRLLLADTGSTNGTFINGRRLTYGKAELLDESDKMMFGTVEVVFERLEKPEPVAEPVQTAAPTVAIGDFEFASRRSDESNNDQDASVPRTENQIDLAFHGGDTAGEK
jgi:pSer/pThr/pTyr-binding forkhead associated (FHA) protein